MAHRSDQRAARALMKIRDIKYTHALRLITTGQVTYERNGSEYTFKEET